MSWPIPAMPPIITYGRPPNAAVNQFEEQPCESITNRRSFNNAELENDCEGNPNTSTGGNNLPQTVYRPLIPNSTSDGDWSHFHADPSVQHDRLDPSSQQGNGPLVVNRGAHGFESPVQGISPQPRPTPLPASEPAIHSQTLEVIHENPTDPANTSLMGKIERDSKAKSEHEYQQERLRQRDEKRSHRKEIEAVGGACLRCYVMKKRCEPSLNCNNCQKSRWVCLRGSEKLRLDWVSSFPDDMSSNESALQVTIDNASRQPLACLDALIRELSSQTSAFDWGSEAALKFHWSKLDSSPVEVPLDTTFLTEFPGFAALPASLDFFESRLLDIVPTSRFPYLSNLEKSTILRTSVSILQLVSLFINIPNAQLFAIPGHYFQARTTLTFLLIYLAKSIGEKIEVFTSDLMKRVRQLRRKVQTPGEVQVFYDAWLAAGVYYNVVAYLSDFEPPSMVSELFSTTRHILVDRCAALRNILKLITERLEFGELGFPSEGESPNNRGPWPTFAERFPVPSICRSLQVAFYFSPEVPTALWRQDSPFYREPIAICELLNPGFYEGYWTLSISPNTNEDPPAMGVEDWWTPSGRDHVLRDEQCSPISDSDNPVELGSNYDLSQRTEMPLHDGEDSTLVGGSVVNNEEDPSAQGYPDPHFGSTTPNPDLETSMGSAFVLNSCGSTFDHVSFDLQDHYDNMGQWGHTTSQSKQDREDDNRYVRLEDVCPQDSAERSYYYGPDYL